MTSYDRFLYPPQSIPEAHPDRIGAVARLFGLTATPLDGARVLELGCGSGSHIIPIAADYPHAEFTGVDLAELPIQHGQQIVQELRLRNVRLEARDILEIPDDWGPFDYVIAHGVYSWVPDKVRSKLLDVAARLTPSGVAYISYNAYPGCHIRQALREMMLFHIRDISEPHQRVRAGLQFLLEVDRLHPVAGDSLECIVKEEFQRFKKSQMSYVFHDDLADINQPVLFKTFVTEAAERGLRYLGEARFCDNFDITLSEEASKRLDALSGGDRIVREQYKDFLWFRMFRQSLLCAASHAPATEPQPQAIRNLWIATPFRAATPEVNSADGVPVEFKSGQASVTIGMSAVKRVFAELGPQWPECLHFTELQARVDVESDTLTDILLHALSNGLVDIHVSPPHCVRNVSETPQTSAYNRLLARQGSDVVNCRHVPVQLEDDLALCLMGLLYGARSLSELSSEAEIPEPALRTALERIAAAGLLVA